MPQQVPDDSMTTAFAPLEAPAAGAAGTGTGEVDFDAYTTTMPQVRLLLKTRISTVSSMTMSTAEKNLLKRKSSFPPSSPASEPGFVSSLVLLLQHRFCWVSARSCTTRQAQ